MTRNKGYSSHERFKDQVNDDFMEGDIDEEVFSIFIGLGQTDNFYIDDSFALLLSGLKYGKVVGEVL